MEGDAGAGMAGDRRRQGFEQEGRLAGPVGQRGALELNPGPTIDHALSVQRQRIRGLRDQHIPRPL
jgi:hypothetical protein